MGYMEAGLVSVFFIQGAMAPSSVPGPQNILEACADPGNKGKEYTATGAKLSGPNEEEWLLPAVSTPTTRALKI